MDKPLLFMEYNGPFPLWQGTQVLISQQIEELACRGYKIILLTYGNLERVDYRPGGNIIFYEIQFDVLNPSYALKKIEESLKSKDVVHLFPYQSFCKRFIPLHSGPTFGRVLLDVVLLYIGYFLTTKLEFDIYFAHHVEASFNLYLLKKIKKKPLIIELHTSLEGELPSYFKLDFFEPLLFLVGKKVDTFLIKKADLLIVVSPLLKEMAQKYNKNVVYIPPWTDDLSMEEGESSEKNTITYVGNLDKYQGVEELLIEAKKVVEQFPDWEFLIITNSTVPPSILSILKNRERIKIIGYKDWETAKRYIMESAITVVPRLIEGGFPVKLLNYLSFGKPCIVRDKAIKGNESIFNQEVVEIVYKREEWSKKLKALIEDKARRDQLKRNARKVVTKHFNKKYWGELLDNLILGLNKKV